MYAAALPLIKLSRMSKLLSISGLALVAAGLSACGRATDQPAGAGSQAQTPAIVQPGAPGQDSAVVSKVPASHDNNYTDADVKFMQGMIHHHNQALLMAAMIPTHTKTAELIAFGKKIELSQGGEITSMKAWLTSRQQQLPMIMPDGSAHMGHEGMTDMPGMLTPEQMKA